ELRPEPALVGLRRLEAGSKLVIRTHKLRPALDAARSLEPRDGGDELRARQPERRRKRLAVLVVRRLLGNCGAAERAAGGYAPKRGRRAAELPFDDRAVAA